MRGKSWRQQPFPGPLDLLLALIPSYNETAALRLISDRLVQSTIAAETETMPDYLAVSLGPQQGKALALDTPIATPDGWATMGTLKVGDQVFDRRGKPCNVVAVSQVWHDRPCYAVRTGDGEAIVADAAHEWPAVLSPKAGRPFVESIVETTDLAVRRSKNPQITGPADLELPTADLPLDPYVMGVWLGDGTTTKAQITTHPDDSEILDRIRAAGIPVHKNVAPYGWSLYVPGRTGRGGKSATRLALEAAGVLGDKHVPDAYMRGSRAQRLALLQGLVDTDGYVAPDGQVEFCATNLRLAEAVRELVFTLGAKATMTTGRATLNGRDVGPKYRVRFYMVGAAHLPRKAERCADSSVARRRYVWAEPTESVPTVCIEVDSYDHTFLAGRSLLPTHNSSLIAYAYPLWLWLRDPDLRIMIISYDNETSVRWGRDIKNALRSHAGEEALFGLDLHLSLRPGSEAVNRLQLDGHRGSISCMSLTGGIAGRPADRVILDDVVKDRQTARSQAFKRVWRDQWQSNISVRLGPSGLAVMDHTRWAEDDPIGQQLAENGARWKYLNIPAVVEHRARQNDVKPSAQTPDVLGRTEGEWLVSARGWTPEQWVQKRADVGEADFWALYQGQPYPAAGGLFQRATFRYWQATGDPWTIKIPGRPGPDEDIRIASRFLTVDLAASIRTQADYTVAAAWAIAGTGQLLLLDLIRIQIDPARHWDEAVGPLASRWQCPIYVEKSAHGTNLITQATREGFVIYPLDPDVDKFSRAVPAARRMEQFQILFPPAVHWMPDFESEILAFPTGSHDDQVDVLSYASRVRDAIWLPPQSDPPHRPQRSEADSAFGGSGVDISSAAL